MQINLSRRNLIEFDSSAFTTDDDQEVLRSIKELDISFNNISTLKGFHRLSTLTTVDVSHNSITSLRGLPLSLRKLNASFNALSDLEGLVSLLHLEILVVSHNQITSLRGLPAKLRMIDASSNRIASIVGVEKCNGLEGLQISQNMIRTSEGLESLKSLHAIKSLTIAENPVTRSRRHITTVCSLFPDNLQFVDFPPAPMIAQSSGVSSQCDITHAVSSSALSLNTTGVRDAINLSVVSSASTERVSHETSIYGCQTPAPSYLLPVSPKGIEINEEEIESLGNKKIVSFDGAEKSIGELQSSGSSVTVLLPSSAGRFSVVSATHNMSLTQEHSGIERMARGKEIKATPEVGTSFSEIPTKRVTESMVEQLQTELDECRRECASHKKENAKLRQRIQELELANKQESKSQVKLLEENPWLQFPCTFGSSSMKRSALLETLNEERSLTHGSLSINPMGEEVKGLSSEASLNCEEKNRQSIHQSPHHQTQEPLEELPSLDEKAELRRGARSLAALLMSIVPASTHSLTQLDSASAGSADNDNHHQRTSPFRGSGMDCSHKNNGLCSPEQQEQEEQNAEDGQQKRTVSFAASAYYSPPPWQT